MARKLIVEIVGDSSSLEKALGRSTKATQKFSVGMGTILKTAVGFTAITEGFRALGDAVRAGADEFSDATRASAQTLAVLRSTNGVAGVTAKQVDTLATSLSNLSGIDDETVKSGENILLTFTNIRNAVGKGNDIFTQTTKAVTDMSVALGQDMKNSAIQVGKALNDPVRGLTALRRVGVSFTDQQVKQIKTLAESGKTMQAQKLILRELNKEFGGSAKALGKTLPGQLNVIKERFKDLAGEVLGGLLPAFTRVTGIVADFAKRLAAAKGARAKFKVVFEGVKNIGRDLFNQLVAAFRQIDWAASVKVVRDGLVSGVNEIGSFLDRVDWGQVGRAISDGLARAIQAVTQFLQSVDWGVVGREVVRGIADFLKSVNWKAVAVTTVKLLVAALKGAASLLAGAGLELGKQTVRAIGQGVELLGREIEKKAIQIVLRVLKLLDFKVLGRSVIPGIDSLVKSLEARLDDLAAHAEKTGDRVQKALEKAAGSVNRSAAIPTKPKAQNKSTANSDQTTVNDAAKAAKTAADKQKAAAEAAAKKAAEIADKQRAAFDDLMDAISLRFDQASARGKFAQAVKAAKDEQAAILKQIKAEGKTPELLRKLFDARQAEIDANKQLADQAHSRTQARQFRGLGLTSEGETPVPGVPNLKKQLAQLTDRLGADAAPKIKSQIARIGKVLAGSFGKVTLDTRQKIKELIDTIRDGLGNLGGSQTKTTGLNTKKVLAGLGFDPDKLRELRGRLSSFNSAGVGLAGAGRAPTGGFVGAGKIEIVNHNVTTLDGKVIAKDTSRRQEKIRRRNPPRRRGPFRGL